MGNINLNFYRQISKDFLSEEESKEHEEMVRQYDQEEFTRESTATWRNCGASEFMLNRSGFDCYVKVSPQQDIVREQVERYAERILKGSSENLIMTGNPGVGKTFFALSALKKFCLSEKPKIMVTKQYAAFVERIVDGEKQFVQCKFGDKDYDLATHTEWCGIRYFHKGIFTKSTDFCDAVSVKKYGQSNNEVWNYYKKAELLVIDEIGRTNNKSEQPLLFKLLDARIDNELPTIITTNLNMEELKEYLGEATMSRLMGNSMVLELSGLPDMRRNRGERIWA